MLGISCWYAQGRFRKQTSALKSFNVSSFPSTPKISVSSRKNSPNMQMSQSQAVNKMQTESPAIQPPPMHQNKQDTNKNSSFAILDQQIQEDQPSNLEVKLTLILLILP